MTDSNPRKRDLGPQPIEALLERYQLTPHALVAASTEQLTHKTVARACKGRRLTPNSMGKVQRALNAAAGTEHGLGELFTYASRASRAGTAEDTREPD